MTHPASVQQDAPVVLIFDDDVIARSGVAAYLRQCGHTVIEAAREKGAKAMLNSPKIDIDIVICAMKDMKSAERFEFAHWVREHHPDVRVLIAATVEKTTKLAADICEDGPHLRKPYEHQNLLEWIKLLRARTTRTDC